MLNDPPTAYWCTKCMEKSEPPIYRTIKEAIETLAGETKDHNGERMGSWRSRSIDEIVTVIVRAIERNESTAILSANPGEISVVYALHETCNAIENTIIHNYVNCEQCVAFLQRTLDKGVAALKGKLEPVSSNTPPNTPVADQPDESMGFRIVKKGKHLTFCLDDSFVNCQCIGEPFISQIVDAFNANLTMRGIGWQPIEVMPKGFSGWLGAVDGNGDDYVKYSSEWATPLEATHFIALSPLPPIPRNGIEDGNGK